ncbi:MAG: response regulator transcription factor [Oscillospiraceae bacterium]|nr:response regulator transcription factor [Oscillospiraceae bacterium]
MKILVIEDEKMLADSIKAMLQHNGFQVECVYDGEAGKEYAQLGIYDLLILDVMMPKMDGLEVARQVRRARCNTPILMLTARSDVADRIAGLNAGADYYLTKPFDSGELLASINALLRRQAGQVNEMVFGNTALDLETSTLLCDGKTVRLTAKEFDVMRLLLQSGKRNLSKSAIISYVWGLESNAVENHVEVYVAILRKRLSSIGSNVKIVSIRGLGYHLEVKES